MADFNIESFKPLIDQQPELVILGTGKNLTFPDHQALQAFHQAGIGVEVMNTASACRTFNVLVSEKERQNKEKAGKNIYRKTPASRCPMGHRSSSMREGTGLKRL